MGGEPIAWTIRDTHLGLLGVATTERGVCHVRFGEDEDELARAMEAEFVYAVVVRDDARAGAHADALAAHVETGSGLAALPLDVRGSHFQRRVWDALRAIPRGETRSYGEVARELGRPGAARAVARACASNPVPLAVPCHRVVTAAGHVGGYRHGSWRKRALLEAEAPRPRRRKRVSPGEPEALRSPR